MKCFISGPVTGVKGYAEKFAEAERILRAEGHEVFNPARVYSQDGDYEAIMTECLLEIANSDCICMLPGWQRSLGANREYGFAKGRGIQIAELGEVTRC